MKNLFIILICLFLTSCMTVNKVKRNCDIFMTVCEVPVKKEVEIITNIVTEVIYRDTTIYVKVTGKTVIKEVPVYIVEGVVNSELSVLNVDFARSYARVVGSRLEHELTQTDTLLLFKLKDALKVVKTQEKQIKTLREKYVIEIEKNTSFAKFAINVFWGLLIAVVLASGILIWKFKSKLLPLFKVNT